MHFLIYEKNEKQNQRLSKKVALKLTESFQNVNKNVTVDNFLSSSSWLRN